MSRLDMSGAMSPCCKKDKIRSTRARCSIASRRFARCEAVRCRAEFSDRWATSASAAVGEGQIAVEEVERALVVQTLARCDGNRTHAARVLGLSVRTLRNKIRLYAAEGVEVPAHRE